MAYFSTQGCALKIDISSTKTTIPQIYEINAPGIERRFKETTHLGSSGNFAEYAALMNDTSEAGAKGRWDPDNSVHDLLMDNSILAVAIVDLFELLFSNTGASVMAFSAFIMRFKPIIAANDIGEFDLGLRVTGAITYTQ